jgi:sugar lactone lactonase YvrE
VSELALLLDGLRFAEAPRWHDGQLWFSDIFARRIMTVDEAGHSAVFHQFGDDVLPCGLGFLPGGDVLVVNMQRPELLRIDQGGQVSVHADLATLATGGLNDMVVDGAGTAYVGSMGTHGVPEPRPVDADGTIIRVDPDGRATVAAQALDAPNGPVLTHDGGTYVVAEFPAARLAAFDRTADGSLVNRRIWADLQPGSADGITIDVEGGVWTASPREGYCRRVLEGGRVTDVVDVPGKLPLACCLGGHDGRTLFILSAVGTEDDVRQRTNTSVIETTRVSVPGH